MLMEPTLRSRLQLRVLGLRRSGNHAIVNWIRRQCSGPTVFLNNVRPGTDPWQSRDNPEGPPPARPDLLIYSYEDARPKLLADRTFARRRAEYLGACDEHRSLLILRDPYNLFASRIRHHFGQAPLRFFSMADLWLLHAREYLGHTRYLGSQTILVSYDRWCVDYGYRRALAETLGIPFTDTGFDEVTDYGGGSSFEGTQLTGRGSAMRVRERHVTQAGNSFYYDLFRDPRIAAYSARIFPEFPELDAFFRSAILPHVQGRSHHLRSPMWDRTPIPLEPIQDTVWRVCDAGVDMLRELLPGSAYSWLKRFRRALY
jgi:hypothetical protein